jgi:hypothetical protein
MMVTSDLIALFALLIAAASAWFSFRSTQLSHRAYQLALAQAARQEAGLSLYLADYQAIQDPKGHERVFAFRIVVTNESDIGASIRSIELVVECSRKYGPASSFRLPLDPSLPVDSIPDAERMRVPLPIPGRSVVSGAALFRLPLELLHQRDVESYTLRVVDGLGATAEREALFVNERRERLAQD